MVARAIDRAWESGPFRWGRDHLPIAQRAVDAAAWLLAVPISTFLRYDGHVEPMRWGWILLFAVLGATASLVTGEALGLYQRKWRYGSFDEVVVVAISAVSAALLLTVARLVIAGAELPRSVPMLAGLLALILMCLVRYVWRLLSEASNRPRGDDLIRVVIFGAGERGAQIIRAMLHDRRSPYLPVALIDDNPRNRKLRINGIHVRGTRHDLAAVAETYGATAMVIAPQTAEPARIRELTDLGLSAGLQVLVLPVMQELADEAINPTDIRPVTEADLLSRPPAELDIDAIAGYITNKRVLVTGAGGSIGSELCRQINRFGPAELIMLDRDESALHALQLSLEGHGLLDTPNLVLADLRDRARLLNLFGERRPDVVFHAAALKHLTLLESNPDEAWKTNVVGTQNVLDAALAANVQRLVNISTDKAADPTCVLGYSKRIAERLTSHVALASGRPFVSVRFGNVLGSRGSMLPTFTAQITRGGPVTVTHPDVTRFFMTIEEAVRLTVQAGAIGRSGEVLVLDMGDPVRIADIARRLIEQSGKRIRIRYTELRPGEKLHEVLFGIGEVDDRPFHPLVSHCAVPPLSFDVLFEAYQAHRGPDDSRVEALRSLAEMSEYHHGDAELQEVR
jgi:FlaA1/EpsC-like NDP-sugar epimerase